MDMMPFVYMVAGAAVVGFFWVVSIGAKRL